MRRRMTGARATQRAVTTAAALYLCASAKKKKKPLACLFAFAAICARLTCWHASALDAHADENSCARYFTICACAWRSSPGFLSGAAAAAIMRAAAPPLALSASLLRATARTPSRASTRSYARRTGTSCVHAPATPAAPRAALTNAQAGDQHIFHHSSTGKHASTA